MQKGAVINDIRGATTLSVLGAVLVPISLVYVLFSTPRSRRQPIFWIQSLALLLAMAQAAVEVASYHVDIDTNGLHPPVFFTLCAARESLKWIVPWLTDCALVFKILYFYPRSLYNRKKQVTMVAFPAIIKVPRLVVIAINLVIMCRAFTAQETTWANGLKFQVAEIAMQVADNSYCSSILLYKSWRFFSASSNRVSRTARAQRRARHIIESIAMSFVPALCIQIAFLVVQAIPGNDANRLVEAQNYLFIFNVYISLIFSILATSWSSICNVAEMNRASAGSAHRPLHLSPGTSASKTGTSIEKQDPEHRTLLHYLTAGDEIEELSSVSEDSASSGGFAAPRRRHPSERELEKGDLESSDSLHHDGGAQPLRRAQYGNFGGVVVRQDRLRATSPPSSHSAKASNPFPSLSAQGRKKVPQLDGEAPKLPAYQSPQISPFHFQTSGSSSDRSFSLEDDGDSRASQHPSPPVELELDDRLSFEDMMKLRK